MDASYKIQRGIHVHLIQFFMCPEFWVHITGSSAFFSSACVRFPRSRPYCKVKGGEPMEEVLDHNQEAEQIFRQYGRLLELVAAAQLPGRPEDAEECVQDAVWAFVEGRAPWDPAQGSKQTWLCVLVRSRAKDRRRALAARMEEPLEEHSGLAAADHAERAAVRDGLRRVLEGLSREERRLFTLRFVYGLSSAELGGVLGLSPNGVDARVSRLRKKLKRLLARQGLGLWEREGTK